MRGLAAALFWVSALCAAQSASPIERPDVKVGDRWTYQRTNLDTGKGRGRYEMQVVFADRGVIQVVNTWRGKEEEEVDAAYTADWSAVTAGGRMFVPHNGWLSFPLRVGDSYSASFDSLRPKMREATFRHHRRAKVVGWEEVVVPAGKFRALKVILEGNAHDVANPSRTARTRNVIWYVPEVKRWVKIVNENRPSGGGPGEQISEELVTFRLQ